LQSERNFINREIDKRINVLKASTGNSDAEVKHLSDNEFVEIMTKHEDNMQKHIYLQLVKQSGRFTETSEATRSHARLKLELLAHAHKHTDILLRVAKAADAAVKQARSTSGEYQDSPDLPRSL
jgi:calcineurin-like phosphoesterase family protein